ncbi:argininosuccinate synthase-related protein [Streptomyces sp. NPDC094437]|uniref:argininosuccinate synthase-related protein n=1 Tax=Streptomyces sp. NPDC094437 TaxID=3366060 RepID=UPI0038068E47
MRHPRIRSFQQIEHGLDPTRPVVTLFSGGLDSSYLLLRLRQLGVTDVHAVTVDLGEDESSAYKREVADALGAKLHVLDRKQEFAESFVAPAISAQAVYLGIHPVSSTLSRPLIARAAVQLADSLGAQAIIHTANRSQNTLRRLNGALELLGYPELYGSPYDLDPVDRDEKHRALLAAGVDLLNGRLVSGDSNLWCREFESGILDDPENHAVPEEMYRWSAPDPSALPTAVTVSFEKGRPTAVDGSPLPLVDMIALLNRQVGAYGLGRYSGLEHLDHGEKVLEIREMPAAMLLLDSYRHLEAACLDAELIREKRHLEQIWVREALEGRWFGELRVAAQQFIDSCAQRTTGSVTWRLRAGGAETRSIVAPAPLYLRDRERWEERAIAAEAAAYTAPQPVLV